jgi:hypothetical protein
MNKAGTKNHIKVSPMFDANWAKAPATFNGVSRDTCVVCGITCCSFDSGSESWKVANWPTPFFGNTAPLNFMYGPEIIENPAISTAILDNILILSEVLFDRKSCIIDH